MTDQNNAAQPVSEETRQAMAKALSDHMDRFSGDGYFRIDPFDDNEVNALLDAALSKLRAEGVQATLPNRQPDDLKGETAVWAKGWNDCLGLMREMMASAPVAGEAQSRGKFLPEHVTQQMIWNVQAVVEAECNGLALDTRQARNVMSFLMSEHGPDAAPQASEAVRTCTCHPDDQPDGECQKQYAARECQIQAAIDHAPEHLRRLGEYLSRVLDEDQWAVAERMLLGACNSKVTDERSAYEAWVRTREGHPFARQFSNLMWEAWKARASLKTQADKDGAVCSCPTGDGSLLHPCAVHPDCAKGAGDERAAFEEHWKRDMNIKEMDLWRCEFQNLKYEDQPYACHETNRGWMTWQAARAALDTYCRIVAAAQAWIDLKDKIKQAGRPPHTDFWCQAIHYADRELRTALAARLQPSNGKGQNDE